MMKKDPSGTPDRPARNRGTASSVPTEPLRGGRLLGGPTRRLRTEGVRVFGAMVALCLLAGSRRTWAEFAPPIRVTDGSGAATQTATGLDLANNAYISAVVNDRILIKIIGAGLNVDAPIMTNGVAQGDPDFATNYAGTTYLVFCQMEAGFVGEGREIYLTHNNGGHFVEPTRLTRNREEDFAPRLVLGREGDPHVVWVRSVGNESHVLYLYSPPEGKQGGTVQEEVLVAKGEYPVLFVDEDGAVHVVYSRGNDLYYNNNRGGKFQNEKRVTTTILDPESSISMGVDPIGNVLVSYESRNSLYFATMAPNEGFQPPRLLDKGGVLTPRMRVRREGQVTIVYSKDGDIWYVVGQSTELNVSQSITVSPEVVESFPSLEVDLANNIHLSYIVDGEVWYTNNAATPDADFSAGATMGEAPLTVRFRDLSNGDIQVWEWDFGDGATSTTQNPTHTYQIPEKYTVTLTVSGPGGKSSSKVRTDYIQVLHPFNTIMIPDQLVIPGQENVWFPVIGSHKEPIQGFQLMARYDPNFLSLSMGADDKPDYELAGTVIASLDPEFIAMNDHGWYFEVGCIFDFREPYDKPKLVAGDKQTLLFLLFDISPDAPQKGKTRIELVNNRDISDILNIFIVDGHSRYPALKSSTVEIFYVTPPYPKLFIRGDQDMDGQVNISDAIAILNFLFLGGAPPACMDAADVVDTGKIDISDAITLLNYLFLGGYQPSVPFPLKGLDPTEDAFFCATD